ncbi:hypothetical protein WJX73_004380 [Symbiochloris irregularis]|uniref:Uncharacterized protein n=1 Tax=Symbiochloris irregularis TaxID=706552 RepID=A0AAW1NPI1_9CHLO
MTNEAPSRAEVHLLPCSIGYSGPATVDAHYECKPVGKSTSGDAASGTVQASFRGRGLHGAVLALPDAYSDLPARVMTWLDFAEQMHKPVAPEEVEAAQTALGS